MLDTKTKELLEGLQSQLRLANKYNDIISTKLLHKETPDSITVDEVTFHLLEAQRLLEKVIPDKELRCMEIEEDLKKNLQFKEDGKVDYWMSAIWLDDAGYTKVKQ